MLVRNLARIRLPARFIVGSKKFTEEAVKNPSLGCQDITGMSAGA